MPCVATSSTSWTQVLRRVLDKRGVDSQALFQQAGLDFTALDDPHARYPLTKTTHLWRLAVAATSDHALGLAVASNVTPTTFRALGFSLIASRTLEEAFERTIRYFRLVSDACDLAFAFDGEHYRFEIRARSETTVPPAPEAIDAFASLFIRFCRSLGGRDLAPLKVRLQRDTPPVPQIFERMLRAPLEFCADNNEMWFTREAMQRPLETADSELARYNEKILVRELALREHAGIKDQARAFLIEQLPRGEPSAKALADHLYVSLRSLQRKLAKENTSYDTLLSETRHTLALSYLLDPQYSSTEITYLLGYSDTSSFTRAFRRWTGETPSSYRANKATEI